jgi:orotate phosphoribosyltransferase
MSIEQALLRIGAIQFGRFETRPGRFQPLKINLRLLPSYPDVLEMLAEALAPLIRLDGLTHLLVMPAAVPIGVAVSLKTGIPLVYPPADDPQFIEGAFDYNVPTLLLTDVLHGGSAERAMIAHARKQGLEVWAVVAVFDLGHALPGKVNSLYGVDTVLALGQAQSPHLRLVVQAWLESQRGVQPESS